MKLLFDQNLSPHLPRYLIKEFPNSLHVRDVGLACADDWAVWSYAKDNDLVIVSKDSDFHQMSFTFGAPPKVVWIQSGNCSTEYILDKLKASRSSILEFGEDPESAFMELVAR